MKSMLMAIMAVAVAVTFSAPSFAEEGKDKKDEKKGGWGFSGMEHLNAYDVVSQQARQFMTSHTGPMIAILNNLQAVAA
mgnify:CR=1 FL=1